MNYFYTNLIFVKNEETHNYQKIFNIIRSDQIFVIKERLFHCKHVDCILERNKIIPKC